MFTILCFLVVKKLTRNISKKDPLRIFVLLFRMKKNGRLLRAVGAGVPGEGGGGHQILANQLALSQQGGGKG